MLGIIAQQEGDSNLALQMMDAALAARPDFLQARFNRSVILRALGRNEEALQSLRKLLATAPDFAVAWDLAGQLFKDIGNLDQSAVCHLNALKLQPNNAHFLGNYALLRFAQGDCRTAYQAVRKAEALDPTYPPLLLGNILRAWGHPDEAALQYAKVRSFIPNFPDACASEAMARLQMGDFEKGLDLWEQRPDLSPDLAFLPLWQGQSVDTLLLYEDQGLGDAIQFLRYIPPLTNRTRKLSLRINASLVDLCTANFQEIDVIPESAPIPQVQARVRLSSLPYFFETRLDNIPETPYLKTPSSTAWTERLKGRPRPLIGLVWAGNSKFRNDATRSISFNTLDPLLSCGAAHFVSIQKERTDLSFSTEVFDAAPFLDSFLDTAALISELDLVISVDTSTAHLCGALGVPLFLLLPFNPDWRWLLGREDTPWYSSAKLFRQRKPGDWASVIQSVSSCVRRFMSGDKLALRATPWRGELLTKNPDALPL